jgi:hypothetical protein
MRATVVGATALRRIKMRPDVGRVHSVFNDAFNIATGDGGLISVVSKRVGSGPINVVVDLEGNSSMLSLHVNQRQLVTNEGNALLVHDSVRISLNHASEYKPSRHFRTREIGELTRNLEVAKEVALREGHFEGVGELVKCLTSRGGLRSRLKLNGFATVALPSLSELMKSAMGDRYSRVRDSAKNLVGLGPGLTPSADDVLAGFMLALMLVGVSLGVEPSRLNAVNQAVASTIGNVTTLLSREYLYHAASGEGNEQVLNLIESIFASDSIRVMKATRKLLVVGETSGTDTLLGVFLGAKLAVEWATRAAA